MRMAAASIVLVAVTVAVTAAGATGAGMAAAGAGAAAAAVAWTPLAPGLDLAWITARTPSAVGDSRIAVVRADPARWELDVVTPGATGAVGGQTAREWAEQEGLAVAINAGMFAGDYLTHLGYLELRGQVLARAAGKYQSVAAFDPRPGSGAPPFRIFDLDEPGVTIETIRARYASLVQNLRLVRRPGENRWAQQPRQWSEAALGEDAGGNVLFVFSRSPFSMRDLNHELLAVGIGLVALQHLEGGPEAQLYVGAGDFELELFGSFETGFTEGDDNPRAWPVPNVIGIRPRQAIGNDR